MSKQTNKNPNKPHGSSISWPTTHLPDLQPTFRTFIPHKCTSIFSFVALSYPFGECPYAVS